MAGVRPRHATALVQTRSARCAAPLESGGQLRVALASNSFGVSRGSVRWRCFPHRRRWPLALPNDPWTRSAARPLGADDQNQTTRAPPRAATDDQAELLESEVHQRWRLAQGSNEGGARDGETVVKTAIEEEYTTHEKEVEDFLLEARKLPTLEAAIERLTRKIAKMPASAERRLRERARGDKEAELAVAKSRAHELEVRVVERLGKYPELPDPVDGSETEQIKIISGRRVAARLTSARLKVLSRHGMGLVGQERARRAAEYQAVADYYERLLRKFRERAQETATGGHQPRHRA